MYCARRNEDVDPMVVRALDCSVYFLDIRGITPCQTTDHRAEISVGNGFDRFEIAWRCGGKTGFNNVHV